MSHGAPLVAGTRWFAPCSVFAFGLGINMAKTGLYLKRTSTNVAIAFLSNLSFYIYSINGPLLDLVAYPMVFVAALLLFATMLYTFDEAVKRLVGLTRTKLWARRMSVTVS